MFKSTRWAVIGACGLMAFTIGLSPLFVNAQAAQDEQNQNQNQQEQRQERNQARAEALAEEMDTETLSGRIHDLYTYVQEKPEQDESAAQDQTRQQGENADNAAQANRADRAQGAGQDANAQRDKQASPAEGAPIVLVAEGSGLANLVPGKSAYVILFDSADEESQKAYKKAREMVGKEVAIEGKTYDKGGLQVVVVADCKAATPDAAKSDR